MNTPTSSAGKLEIAKAAMPDILMRLAELNVPPDVQELLVYGNAAQAIAPHALARSLAPCIAHRPEAGEIEALYHCRQHIGWLKQYALSMEQANWRDMKDRIIGQIDKLSNDLSRIPSEEATDPTRAALEECVRAMEGAMQRSNESGTGEMALIDTINAVHRILRDVHATARNALEGK